MLTLLVKKPPKETKKGDNSLASDSVSDNSDPSVKLNYKRIFETYQFDRYI